MRENEGKRKGEREKGCAMLAWRERERLESALLPLLLHSTLQVDKKAHVAYCLLKLKRAFRSTTN